MGSNPIISNIQILMFKMNQLRLSNQYNFVGVFDFIDNNFTRTESFLIFDTSGHLQVYHKLEEMSRITFISNLFLECITGQKFFIRKDQNTKKKDILDSIITIRNKKIFQCLEILLLSLFVVRQSNINLQELRIIYLDFFWPNIVLDNLLVRNLIHSSFAIYGW